MVKGLSRTRAAGELSRYAARITELQSSQDIGQFQEAAMEMVTESRIAGAFRGWRGRGVYKLANGQVWKQVHYKYSYHYAYRPKAVVWRDGSAYYLEVEGMSDMIKVRRGSSSDLADEDED